MLMRLGWLVDAMARSMSNGVESSSVSTRLLLFVFPMLDSRMCWCCLLLLVAVVVVGSKDPMPIILMNSSIVGCLLWATVVRQSLFGCPLQSF